MAQNQVQKELEQLRQQGLTNTHRDKLKDVSGATLSTPEREEEFLNTMHRKSVARDQVVGVTGEAANAGGDATDLWYQQQRQREKEERERRNEAVSKLHDYKPSSAADIVTTPPPVRTTSLSTNSRSPSSVAADAAADAQGDMVTPPRRNTSPATSAAAKPRSPLSSPEGAPETLGTNSFNSLDETEFEDARQETSESGTAGPKTSEENVNEQGQQEKSSSQDHPQQEKQKERSEKGETPPSPNFTSVLAPKEINDKSEDSQQETSEAATVDPRVSEENVNEQVQQEKSASQNNPQQENRKEGSSAGETPPSSPDFTSALAPKEVKESKLQLDAFCVQHAVHHRPIAVVTSGGTVADLEQNSVRCLDNFSTGLRGSISVEELLLRGYAVIHLWRTGSAAPFARVLSQCLGLRAANDCLTVESLGRLFAIAGEDEQEDLVQSVLQAERDPWLSSPPPTEGTGETENAPVAGSSKARGAFSAAADRHHQLELRRGLAYSTRLQRALRERTTALSEGRLLTVPFRSVEEYLGKLQLCAEAVKDCQSLAMFFLAAAVSDFYIPVEQRTQHKIQSGDAQDGLVLRLAPVPKVMGLLREQWAPNSFVVSFKLETDHTILRNKANRAVEKYGCHMVVGNLLKSRHEKVWILAPDDQREKSPTHPQDWAFTPVTRSSAAVDSSGTSIDTLESAIIDFCVESHFEFISWHFHSTKGGSNTAAAVEAAKRAQHLLKEKKRRVQRELFWKRATTVGLELAGGVLAVAISYAINTALRKRLQS